MPTKNNFLINVVSWIIAPVLALLLLYYPLLLSNFQNIPGDLGDARFNNLILEHTYLWLNGKAELWSPSFFHSAKNVAAYSDILLGVAPFYWIWRFFELDPWLSYGLWLITISILNYYISAFLFSLVIREKSYAPIIGALLFTASSVKISQVLHPQLLFQGYFLLALLALYKIITSFLYNSKPRVFCWFLLFFISLVCQLYSSFYLAWSLILLLIIFCLLACFFANYRKTIFSIIQLNWKTIIVLTILSLLLISPLFIQYQKALSEVGYRTFLDVRGSQPTLISWFNNGPNSLLYGWLHNFSIFNLQLLEHEKRLGIGFITILVSAIGFWKFREIIAVQIVILSFFVTILIMTLWPAEVSLWHYFYLYFPGTAAIRAVGRIAILLSIIPCLGISLWAKGQLKLQNNLYLVFLVSTLMLLEQIQFIPSYNKTSNQKDIIALSQKLNLNRQRCASFLLIVRKGKFENYKYHLDAMWTSNLTGIPTLNGYSGNTPQNWNLDKINYYSDSDRTNIIEQTRAWMILNSISRKSVCLIDKRSRNRKVSYPIKLL